MIAKNPGSNNLPFTPLTDQGISCYVITSVEEFRNSILTAWSLYSSSYKKSTVQYYTVHSTYLKKKRKKSRFQKFAQAPKQKLFSNLDMPVTTPQPNILSGRKLDVIG